MSHSSASGSVAKPKVVQILCGSPDFGDPATDAARAALGLHRDAWEMLEPHVCLMGGCTPFAQDPTQAWRWCPDERGGVGKERKEGEARLENLIDSTKTRSLNLNFLPILLESYQNRSPNHPTRGANETTPEQKSYRCPNQCIFAPDGTPLHAH